MCQKPTSASVRLIYCKWRQSGDRAAPSATIDNGDEPNPAFPLPPLRRNPWLRKSLQSSSSFFGLMNTVQERRIKLKQQIIQNGRSARCNGRTHTPLYRMVIRAQQEHPRRLLILGTPDPIARRRLAGVRNSGETDRLKYWCRRCATSGWPCGVDLGKFEFTATAFAIL
jgi:hypothetical protein